MEKAKNGHAKGEAAITSQSNGDLSKETSDREVWANPAEFVLSCLGYAVGLGNIWRFPWLCYANGGGAFLIPYAVMLTFVGIPVFFQELIIGQYSGVGPLHIWSMSPIFKGAGLGMIFITSMFCIFYCMILGYAIHYLVMSFQRTLPWSHCKHDYNTPLCYSKAEAEPCEEKLEGIWFNQTCYNSTYLSGFDKLLPGCVGPPENCTTNPMREELGNLSKKLVSASEEYLMLDVFELSPNIEETNGMKWELVLVLAAGWVLCGVCLIKGIKSSGKVVYFTALFPYVVLFILMVRGATLPGSLEGVKYYITPQWEKLAEAKPWADAAGQIFFSLSVGGGGLMTFASYNKFNNNIYRDALIVSVGNCLTSVFAGFVIFSILGFMSYELNKPVPEVVTQGSTLAFVAYPTVVAQLPISQLWAVLFFLMLITLGLDSLFAGMETVITAIVDTSPKLRKKKWAVVIAMCVVFWLLGLTMCTRAGLYWLDIIAYYSSGWALVVMGLVECIVFNWIYGAKRIMAHVEEMVGFKLWWHWWVVWTFIAPFALIIILIVNLIDFTPLVYGDYTMPWWCQFIGWCIALTALAFILIGAIVVVVKTAKEGKFKGNTARQNLALLFSPSPEWLPSYKRHASQKNTRTDAETPETNEKKEYNNGSVPPPPSFLLNDAHLTSTSSIQAAAYDNPSFEDGPSNKYKNNSVSPE